MDQRIRSRNDKRENYREKAYHEVISIEEYLNKRKKIKKEEQKNIQKLYEKSPAWMLAGLYI